MSLNSAHLSYHSETHRANSTGLGGGNTILEALRHSVFEIVERHAFSLWAAQPYEHRAAFGVDLNSLPAETRPLLTKIYEANLRPALFDISAFVSAGYCFVANIFDPSGELLPARAYTGRSFNTNSLHAVHRALMEAVQSRATMISGARDDLTPQRLLSASQIHGKAIENCHFRPRAPLSSSMDFCPIHLNDFTSS